MERKQEIRQASPSPPPPHATTTGSRSNTPPSQIIPQAPSASSLQDSLVLSVVIPNENADWTDSKTYCAISTSPECLFTGHDDGSVSMWAWSLKDQQSDNEVSPSTITLLSTFQTSSRFPVISLVQCRLPGQRMPSSVACVQKDGTLSVFADSGSCFEFSQVRLLSGVGEVRSATSFGEGRYLVVIGKSASVLVLDMFTKTPTHLLHGHEDWVSSIAAKDEGDNCSLVSCSDDGFLHLWRWQKDNFASGLRRSVMLFSDAEEESSGDTPELNALSDDYAPRYSISFGGSTLLVVTLQGTCGYIENADIEASENKASIKVKVIRREIVDAKFLEKSKGETIITLSQSHSVSVFNRVAGSSENNASSLFEFVVQLVEAPKSSVADLCCQCLKQCLCSFIVPLRGGGFALTRSTCRESQLSVLIGQKKWEGTKLRAASTSESLFLIIPPPSLNITQSTHELYPTVVVEAATRGNLGVSLLPRLPKIPLNDRVKRKITAVVSFPNWYWQNGACRLVLVGRSNGRLDMYRLTVPNLLESTKVNNQSGASSPSFEIPTLAEPKLKKIESVQAHVGAVIGFSAAPSYSSNIKIAQGDTSSDSRTFCSIGADNEVVVFVLQRLVSPDSIPNNASIEFQLICLFRFSGHHSSVRSVYWDIPASALHVRCDKTFIWSLLSGHLERRSGNSLDFAFKQASRSASTAGAILFAHTPTSLVAGTFENEIDPLSTFSAPRRLDISEEDSFWGHIQPIEFAGKYPPPKSRFGTVVDVDIGELGDAMYKCFEQGLGIRCGLAYSSALSLLHDWGMDPELDEFCKSRFGMIKVDIPVKYCHRQKFSNGGDGNAHLTASNSTMIVSSKRWAVSEYLTANQNLGLVVLFLHSTTFQSIPLQISDTLSQLVTAYGIKFPDILRQRAEWKEPSLQFLAKRALVLEKKDDVANGVHIAARLLLQRTIERMAPQQRNALVSDWSARLQRLRESFQSQMLLLQSSAVGQASGVPIGSSASSGLSTNPLLARGHSTPATTHIGGHPIQKSQGIASKSLPSLLNQQVNAQPQAASSGLSQGISSGVFGTPQAKRSASASSELSSLESDSFIVEEDQAMDDRLRQLLLTNREYQLLVLLLSMVGVVHPADLTPTTARLCTETLVEAISVRDHPHSQILAMQQQLQPNIGTNAINLTRNVNIQGANVVAPNSAMSGVYGTSEQSMKHASGSQFLSASAQFLQHQIRKGASFASVSSGSESRGSPATHPQQIAVEAIAINPAFAAELLAKGFPLFRPHIPHMSRLIKKLLQLACDSDDFPQRATAADRSLSEVGSAHPVLFIRTIGAEVCKRDATDAYRRRTLEVLVNLVKAFPIAFLRHLPLVAEVVIKTLDPSEPALRSSCLNASTMALQELVKRYPMVSL